MVGDAFKALGDPTRRRILELLSEGEMSAGDIAAHFDMAKPSVSHPPEHFKKCRAGNG